MLRNFTALLAGIIFGFGLVISQMVNPQKVLAFLDIFGDWDPSLAFVMGGALLVTAPGYYFLLKRNRPIAAPAYELPTAQNADFPLLVGAVLFGIGWGLVGLCPGPAIAALSFGGLTALIFLAAMAVGMAIFEIFSALLRR